MDRFYGLLNQLPNSTNFDTSRFTRLYGPNYRRFGHCTTGLYLALPTYLIPRRIVGKQLTDLKMSAPISLTNPTGTEVPPIDSRLLKLTPAEAEFLHATVSDDDEEMKQHILNATNE